MQKPSWVAGCCLEGMLPVLPFYHHRVVSGGDSGECVADDMSDGSCHSCSSTCMQQYMHAAVHACLGPWRFGWGCTASESCSMEVLSQQAVLQVDWI
jgi:hypothetical protein